VEPDSHQQLQEHHEPMQAAAVVVQVVLVVLAVAVQVDFLMELLQLPELLTLAPVAVVELELVVQMQLRELLADLESSSFVTQSRRQIPLHQQLVEVPPMGRR
jgi:hypothetical protein